MPALPRTPRRQDRFLFTRTYLTLPIALVIRDDSHFIGDLRELKKQRVGVVRDYASHEYPADQSSRPEYLSGGLH